MGLRNRKEKLPPLEDSSGTAGFEPLIVDLFDRLKGRVRGSAEMLFAEFRIDSVVHAPEPSGNRVGRFYRVLGDVFRETIATVFAGEDVGKSIEEGAYVGAFGCWRETDEMQKTPS
jgi:hypothetical protein